IGIALLGNQFLDLLLLIIREVQGLLNGRIAKGAKSSKLEGDLVEAIQLVGAEDLSESFSLGGSALFHALLHGCGVEVSSTAAPASAVPPPAGPPRATGPPSATTSATGSACATPSATGSASATTGSACASGTAAATLSTAAALATAALTLGCGIVFKLFLLF